MWSQACWIFFYFETKQKVLDTDKGMTRKVNSCVASSFWLYFLPDLLWEYDWIALAPFLLNEEKDSNVFQQDHQKE